jgi:hypothetical protein
MSNIISLIGSALKNPLKIIEGIKNEVKMKLGFLDKDEQDEIIKRRVICAGCVFMSENAKKDPIQMYKSDLVFDHCIHCLCSIELKTASLDSMCGLDAWNKKKPNNQIPLKWNKYVRKTK